MTAQPKPTEDQIRREGIVRTHSAGQQREDAIGRVTMDYKSSIFVMYRTKAGFTKYRNSGIHTPTRVTADESERDGRALAAKYSIPYDTTRVSLHNRSVADVRAGIEATPMACVEPPRTVAPRRTLQLRRISVQQVIDAAPPKAAVTAVRSWVIIQVNLDRDSLGLRAYGGYAIYGDPVGLLFHDEAAVDTRCAELNEAFYARNPKPADAALDLDQTFRSEWPRHVNGLDKADAEITWADAILVGNWTDPYRILELRDTPVEP